MSGFVKLIRSDEAEELIELSQNAFVLLSVIALRAKRGEKPTNKHLEMGEATIGDYEKCGMSRQNYRTARDLLEKCGYITIKVTNRGTIAKLALSSIYDINIDGANQQVTNKQPATNQPANQPLTTNKKIRTKEDKEKKEEDICAFSEWWDLYDYKKDRKKAEAAYDSIMKNKKATHDEIMEGTKKYVEHRRDEIRYWKHPTTFLNGRNWRDEYTANEKHNGHRFKSDIVNEKTAEIIARRDAEPEQGATQPAYDDTQSSMAYSEEIR